MTISPRVILSVISAFALGAVAMLYATAEDRKTLDGLATPIVNVITNKKFVPADVKVNIVHGDDGVIGHGSGVHLGGGRVLTARHVVFRSAITGSKMVVKTRDGEEHSVEVLWSSPLYDITMLQASGMDNIEHATLSCYVPKVGDDVSWVGNILAEDFLTGFGRVGSGYKTDDRVKWRKYFAVYGLVSPGMSGGGVYDTRGKLIGISVGFLGAQQINDDLINSGFGAVVPGHTLCEIMGR